MMNKEFELSKPLFYLLGAFVFLSIFLLDYLSPLGLAVGVLYSGPILFFCFAFESKTIVYKFAFAAAILVLLGYALAAEGHTFDSVGNRILCLLVIFSSAILGNLLADKRSENFFLTQLAKDALYASPSGMIVSNENGRVVLANKQSEVIFGYGPNELLKKSIEDLVPLEFREKHPSLRKGYFANPKIRRMGGGADLFGQRKDGSLVPVEIGLTPMTTNNKRYVISSIVNISKRKKQEAELKEKNARLEEFAFIASHDLKAPIRHIDVFINILRDELEKIDLSKDATYAMNTISQGAKKMHRLTDDLLSYASISQAPLTLEEVNLQNIVDDVTKTLSATYKIEDIEIETSQLPKVLGSKSLLHEVFQNLIGNAMKYKNPNEKAKIAISSEESPSHFIFSIADNGIGIPAEKHTYVFELFKRLHGEKEFPGTGIGLAICKKIIDQHDGKIWVEDSRLGGAEFKFTISKNLTKD